MIGISKLGSRLKFSAYYCSVSGHTLSGYRNEGFLRVNTRYRLGFELGPETLRLDRPKEVRNPKSGWVAEIGNYLSKKAHESVCVLV